MKTDKFRSRAMAFLLYPEDESHVQAIQMIEKSYDYAMILHDNDISEDGEIKKEHWHVVIRFGNAVWNTAICKDLGIETNYCEQIRNFDNALMYLIHYNDSDKFQYSIDEVKGNLKQRLVQAINKQTKDEGEKIVDLIEYIEKHKGYLRVTEFAKYCASNGYWAEFRRSGAIFIKMIDEKNRVYEKVSNK